MGKHYPINHGDNIIKKIKPLIIYDQQRISNLISYLSKLEKSSEQFYLTTIYCRITFINSRGRRQVLDFNKGQIKLGDEILVATDEFFKILGDLYKS